MSFLSSLLTICVMVGIRIAVVAWSRRRREPARGRFRCKTRPGGVTRWPARRSRGSWVHDVLLVERGVLFRRTVAFPVRLPEDVVQESMPSEVPGLGLRPLVVTLRMDDGSILDVAAAQRDRTSLVGPFLAAALPRHGHDRRQAPGGGRSSGH